VLPGDATQCRGLVDLSPPRHAFTVSAGSRRSPMSLGNSSGSGVSWRSSGRRQARAHAHLSPWPSLRPRWPSLRRGLARPRGSSGARHHARAPKHRRAAPRRGSAAARGRRGRSVVGDKSINATAHVETCQHGTLGFAREVDSPVDYLEGSECAWVQRRVDVGPAPANHQVKGHSHLGLTLQAPRRWRRRLMLVLGAPRRRGK
jgi:hypothetical protein